MQTYVNADTGLLFSEDLKSTSVQAACLVSRQTACSSTTF